MSLRDRAQQHDAARAGQPSETLTPKTPVSLFDQPRWGIVDGELVEINGVTDVPGMSPCYLCSDGKDGWSALVPFRENRVLQHPAAGDRCHVDDGADESDVGAVGAGSVASRGASRFPDRPDPEPSAISRRWTPLSVARCWRSG